MASSHFAAILGFKACLYGKGSFSSFMTELHVKYFPNRVGFFTSFLVFYGSIQFVVGSKWSLRASSVWKRSYQELFLLAPNEFLTYKKNLNFECFPFAPHSLRPQNCSLLIPFLVSAVEKHSHDSLIGPVELCDHQWFVSEIPFHWNIYCRNLSSSTSGKSSKRTPASDSKENFWLAIKIPFLATNVVFVCKRCTM